MDRLRQHGKNIHEFLITGADEIGALPELAKLFSALYSKHSVSTIAVYIYFEQDKRRFVDTRYCDFGRADWTPDQVVREIKLLPFVIDVQTSTIENTLYDKLLLPTLSTNRGGVLILRHEALINVEKQLTKRMGSAAAAILFEEGKYYAFGIMRQLKEFVPSTNSEALIENVKDSFRAMGLGRFEFKNTVDGFEVTVNEPPILNEHDPTQNRFLYGITVGALEFLLGDEFAVTNSKYDPSTGKLVFTLASESRKRDPLYRLYRNTGHL